MQDKNKSLIRSTLGSELIQKTTLIETITMKNVLTKHSLVRCKSQKSVSDIIIKNKKICKKMILLDFTVSCFYYTLSRQIMFISRLSILVLNKQILVAKILT